MSSKDEGPYVRFYIQNGVEVASCLASDFRTAMNERDALRAENERLKAEFREQITEEHAAYQELRREVERLRAILDTLWGQAALETLAE